MGISIRVLDISINRTLVSLERHPAELIQMGGTVLSSGGGLELLKRDDTRAGAEDVRPLLRVQAHAQRHRAGADPAQQVDRSLL